MADELSRHAEVQIIGPSGSAARSPSQIALTEAPLRPLWLFLLSAAWQSICISLTWKPDIILAGSGLTAPLAFIAARLTGAKSIAYLHGLDISIPHPAYKTLWLPFIRRMEQCIVNSRPTKHLAIQAGVKEEAIIVVHPGVTIPRSPPPMNGEEDFKKRYNLEGKSLLLSVGRLSRRKGILEFLKYAMPEIIRNHPNAVLTVIGSPPKDALYAAANSIEIIQKAAKDSGVFENLKFLGNVSEDELLRAYEASCLHIFPILQIPGDPEGFGMVAIEAAAQGLPTVAFASDGVVDSVSEGQSGVLITPGDYKAMAQTVSRMLDGQRSTWANGTREFAKKFEWSTFGLNIIRAITRP